MSAFGDYWSTMAGMEKSFPEIAILFLFLVTITMIKLKHTPQSTIADSLNVRRGGMGTLNKTGVFCKPIRQPPLRGREIVGPPL